MSRRKDITAWCIPVPRTLDDALEMAVELDTHASKSDFVRDAVRRELERLGFRTALLTKEAPPVLSTSSTKRVHINEISGASSP